MLNPTQRSNDGLLKIRATSTTMNAVCMVANSLGYDDRKADCCYISISLIDTEKGEGKAHACDMA